MIWGMNLRPRNRVTRKKPTALTTIHTRSSAENSPVTTTLASTASSMTPSTSSMTAAPRMTLVEEASSSPAAPSMPAVMPTEVAASIAPTNQPSTPSPWPSSCHTPRPMNTGKATPTTATLAELAPTLTRSRILDSSPTRNSSSTTASSAEYCMKWLERSISPTSTSTPASARLPRMMPAKICPTSSGMPKRSNSQPHQSARVIITISSRVWRVNISLAPLAQATAGSDSAAAASHSRRVFLVIAQALVVRGLWKHRVAMAVTRWY